MRANGIKKTGSIKKAALGFVLAAALAGVAACGGPDAGDQASGGGSAPASTPASAPASAGAQPELGNVPETVAQVNDEKISKDQFSRAYQSQFQQAQQSGQPVDQQQLKKQVAESMVGTVLLSQEAGRRGFEASDSDIDKTLTDLAKQNGMTSDQEFLEALKKQGMNPDEVRGQVADQVKIDQLMAKEVGNSKPTKAELKKLYDQAKSQQEASGQGKMPPFDEVRSQLVEQAKTERENKVGQQLVKSLRQQGEVKINL